MKISEIAKLVADKNIDIRDIIEYDSDDSLWENIADAIEDINEGDDDYIVATTQQGGRISADKAKAIAFGHAGVSAGQVRDLSVEYDDDGVYEIDFKVGNMEYDYEIGAVDGSIRKADVEQDD